MRSISGHPSAMRSRPHQAKMAESRSHQGLTRFSVNCSGRSASERAPDSHRGRARWTRSRRQVRSPLSELREGLARVAAKLLPLRQHATGRGRVSHKISPPRLSSGTSCQRIPTCCNAGHSSITSQLATLSNSWRMSVPTFQAPPSSSARAAHRDPIRATPHPSNGSA